MDGIINAIDALIDFIWSLVTYVPKYIFSSIMDGLAAAIEAIPVPAWMQNVNIFGGVSSEMAFFLEGFAIPEGILILGSALGLRFLLRRIPLIG